MDLNRPPPTHYPTVPAEGATITTFVPTGWRIEKHVTGDLNGDGHVDNALILHDNNPALRVPLPFNDSPTIDTNPRLLVVLFARAGGGFRRVLANHTLIPRVDSARMDDPVDGIVASDFAIADDTLQIALGDFSAEIFQPAYTFRWIDGAFRLVVYESHAVHRMGGTTREVHIDYRTRRIERRRGNISGDADETVRYSWLPPGPLLTLNQIGDGLVFDPLAGEDASH